MTPKTTTNTTINPPFSADSTNKLAPADSTAQWQEARLVYPIYAALATQFDLAPLPYAPGALPPEKPSRETFDGDRELAHIEALGIRTPVHSMGAGRLLRIAATDGSPVEYGQPLFSIART